MDEVGVLIKESKARINFLGRTISIDLVILFVSEGFVEGFAVFLGNVQTH